MFKRDWLRYYDTSPARFNCVVQSWDTASKDGVFNDYSVCTTWGITGNSYYLRNVFREKLDYPDLRKKVIELHRRHQADFVLIEDANSGTQLIQELRKLTPIRPRACRPEVDKQTRAFAQEAKVGAGQMLLPKAAPWLEPFLKEFLALPGGKHDDQVDSVTQFLKWTETYHFRVDRSPEARPRDSTVAGPGVPSAGKSRKGSRKDWQSLPKEAVLGLPVLLGREA